MKRLYRSTDQKIIAGVCGGIGEYFEIDPVIVRLIWFVFFLFGGVGVLAYIIAWMIVPLEDRAEADRKDRVEEKKVKASYNTRLLWGIILILLGVFFFMKEFWYLSEVFEDVIRFTWRYLIPVLLISIGVYVIVQGDRQSKDNDFT